MNWQAEHIQKQHQGAIYACVMHHEKLYSVAGDSYLVNWQVPSLEQSNLLAHLSDSPFCLAFTAQEILVGTANGRIFVLDEQNKAEKQILQHHTGSVFAIAYNTAEQHAYSVCNGGIFCIWHKTDKWIKLRTFAWQGERLRSIAMSANQDLIALGFYNGAIKIFETKFYNEIQHIQNTENTMISALCFSKTHKNVLLSADKQGKISVWHWQDDFFSTTLLHHFTAHQSSIYSLAYSPDKEYFLSASRDKTIKIWQAKSLDFITKLEKAHTHSINTALWLDNNTIISAGDDRKIILWRQTV